MPLAVAPYTTTYLSRTPYLTVAEYTNAPTAVDTTQLIPGGSPAANQTELANVIARASSWVDSLCYQVLAATSDTDPIRRYRVNADGSVRVPLRYKPILEVDAVSVGYTPSTMQPISAQLAADIAILGMSVVEIPVAGFGLAYTGQSLPAPGRSTSGRLLVQVTYVNGYANTTLSGAVTAGANVMLPVASSLGVYAGSVLTVYDGASTEQVTVTAAGTGSVTVASLANAHAAGVSVSALPPAVKQAAISLTSCLIKTRGAEALTMGVVGAAPTHAALTEGGGLEDLAVAVDLLEPYRRVV